MMWVYWKSEPNLWTVGYYDPQGRRVTESDHDSSAEAAAHVNYLNGGTLPPSNAELLAKLEAAGATSLLLDVQRECIEMRKDRDRWFLLCCALADATNDACDRGYCVLEDADATAAAAGARAAIREAIEQGREQG